MSVLPSPIPHPLEFSPFDVPGWAYEALEWVVGFDWPAGNEVSTWDVADRWYVLAKDLAEPREATFEAAARVLDGYGGVGITADGFRTAFQQLAGDDDAPLNGLLHIADGLGQLVEGCGRDLEGAKLEAWIEIGIFLTELIGMAITVALTFGAASPAAGGLIMTTRMAIQQIFKRLVEQLGTKALKSTAKHAIKEMTTKQGLAKVGRKALHEGLDEAGEEFATNGGIQLYQESTGRSRGFSFSDLGLSAVGGFAGGAAATGSGVGAHGQHAGLARGAGGEVLAEFGAAAAFGDLPGLQNAAKAGASGASGSAIHGMASAVDVSALSTPEGLAPDGVSSLGGSTSSLSPSLDGVGFAPTGPSADGVGQSGIDSGSLSPTDASAGATWIDTPSADAASNGGSNGTSIGVAPNADGATGAATNGGSTGISNGAATAASSADGSANTLSPAGQAGVSSFGGTSADLSAAASAGGPSTDASLGPGPSTAAGTFAANSVTGTADSAATPSNVHLSDISLSSPAASTAPPMPAVAGTPSPSTDPIAQLFTPPPAVVVTPGASTTRRPLSDLDRIAAALAPAEPRAASTTKIPRQRPSYSSHIRPDRAQPSHPDPIRNEAGYFGYAHHARRTHELNRRDEYINYLTSIAEESRAKILSLGHEADLAFRAGLTLRGEDHRRRATEFSMIVDEIEAQIDQIRTGRLAPAKVEVGPQDWARINTDVGNLAPGGVHTDDLSAVTGKFGRLPIDRTRRYNSVGGLRAPLAVHQTDLEDAVPKAGDGRPQRLPDPRAGHWFRLANDGGPEADPTRGLNCVDGVLALFDTYIHGRPRVSAPRTFDTYAHGNPDRPLGGETNGIRRIQEATGTTFQNLCPYVGSAAPAVAKPAIDVALRNLTNHLRNTGHGAYAFIVTDLEAGGSHAWAATNQHGTILFLDPQIGRIGVNAPLYTHRGVRTNTNITSMDALVVDANGTPAPLPHHGPAQRAAAPTGTPDDGPEREGHHEEPPIGDPISDVDFDAIEDAAERRAYESLDDSERATLDAAYNDAEEFADAALEELRDVVSTMPASHDGHRPRMVGEEHRRKSTHSMARAFLEIDTIEPTSLSDFIDSTKDRVRFSVEMSEVGYGSAVAAVLRSMMDRGYQVKKILSFWGTGQGRHNGLNVTLVDSSDRLLEVQFPTPLSGRVGKTTHRLYRRVRSGRFTPQQRVEALMQILSINHRNGLPNHQPRDIDVLAAINPIKRLDTGMKTWVDANPTLWRRYLAALKADGVSLEDRLSRHNLRYDEIFSDADQDVRADE